MAKGALRWRWRLPIRTKWRASFDQRNIEILLNREYQFIRFSGMYLYTEVSTPRKVGDVAIIQTPPGNFKTHEHRQKERSHLNA